MERALRAGSLEQGAGRWEGPSSDGPREIGDRPSISPILMSAFAFLVLFVANFTVEFAFNRRNHGTR